MPAVIADLKRYGYSLPSVRFILQAWGLSGSRDVYSGMYCGTCEYVAAAALARATIGA